MIKLIEVVEGQWVDPNRSKFSLRDIYLNPEHIISIREDYKIKQLITESNVKLGLDDRQQFSKVILGRGTTGQETIVVGSPESIYEKMQTSHKNLLRG